jgi:hypothetical protein
MEYASLLFIPFGKGYTTTEGSEHCAVGAAAAREDRRITEYNITISALDIMLRSGVNLLPLKTAKTNFKRYLLGTHLYWNTGAKNINIEAKQLKTTCKIVTSS